MALFSELPNRNAQSPSEETSGASSQSKKFPPSPGRFGWRGWTIRQRLLAFIVVAFFLVAGTAVTLFLFGRDSFDPNRVQFSINVSEEIVSGETVTFDVVIHNKNKVDLDDAELVFAFPDGALQVNEDGEEQEADAVRVNIHRIRSGETVSRSFEARLLGDAETAQFAEAMLRYRPSSINARFEARHSVVVEVDRSPLELSLEVPRRAVGGEEITYIVRYALSENSSLNTTRIVVEYPDGFHFSRADPDPVEARENHWQFEGLAAGAEGEIVIQGSLDGLSGQVKRLRVRAGHWEEETFSPIVRAEKETIIDAHPLALEIDVRDAAAGSVDIGEKLNYTILFRNEADVALRELILRARLKGDVVDTRNIHAPGASIKDGGGLLEWTAAAVPSLALLAPGEEGEITFSVPLKASFPISSFRDKNFKAVLEAELETPTVPQSFSLGRLVRNATHEVKVNTNLVAQQLVFYNETSSSITNSGPHPPRVGERTTYTVHWRLLNTSNDIDNLTVRSTLPPTVDWTGRTATAFPETELRFNERTREIIWDVGRVPATTGVVLSTYEVVFQIALTPTARQEGERPVLAEEIFAEGVDQFTGAVRVSQDSNVTTNLPDDVTVGGGGTVNP